MLFQACVIAAVLATDPPGMVPAPWPGKSDGKPDVQIDGVKIEPEKTAPATKAEPDKSERPEPVTLKSEPSALVSREVGGVAAPAALPPGAIAFYGLLGAPDVGAGYRQGFSGFELEARALFNYLELSGLFEGGVRIPVLRLLEDRLAIAPTAAIGLKVDSGAKYYDRANFLYVGVRLRAAANASYKLSDTIVGVGLLEVPWAIAVGKAGHQVTPTLGAGAEFHLGERLTLLASLHGGFDVIKEPLGVAQLRFAWAIRLGVGYRLF